MRGIEGGVGRVREGLGYRSYDEVVMVMVMGMVMVIVMVMTTRRRGWR